METVKLTLNLPKETLELAKSYAMERHMTVSEEDPWRELFRLGDALAAEDSPEAPTLTAAVLEMRH